MNDAVSIIAQYQHREPPDRILKMAYARHSAANVLMSTGAVNQRREQGNAMSDARKPYSEFQALAPEVSDSMVALANAVRNQRIPNTSIAIVISDQSRAAERSGPAAQTRRGLRSAAAHWGCRCGAKRGARPEDPLLR